MPNYLRYIVIAVIGSLLFFPFLGQVHLFDWDEINFAECAREMIVSKDYLRVQIDFMPFWEKPPLFIWMQVGAMQLFGVGEFAARFPNALIGVITLLAVYYVGKRVVSEKMGMWWAAIYAASWLPHFYFKTGIIDPTFNLLIFLAFFQVHLLQFAPRKGLHTFLTGILLGLAVLTKGPVAILVTLLSMGVYILLHRGLNGYTVRRLLTIAVWALLPFALWMGAMAAVRGLAYSEWFISEFILYQIRLFSTEDADHGGPFVYHFIVLLLGCFPASAFLFQFTRKRISDKLTSADFTRWMWILFWVVLILFSIVKTKIVHYSSLCYFPLTYLAALQLYRLSEEPGQLKKWIKTLLLTLGSLMAVLITALPLVGIYKQKLIPLIEDKFVVANLEANVSWSYAECMWGILYMAAIWASVLLMKRNFRSGITLLAAAQIVIIQATVLHFTPKIEAYSQRSAIEFYKTFEGKNVYVQPVGYKSYANLFYTKKTAATDSNYISIRHDDKGKEVQPEANADWLMNGKTDKPVFFICKIMDADKLRSKPNLSQIGGSNGFVFFRRNDR